MGSLQSRGWSYDEHSLVCCVLAVAVRCVRGVSMKVAFAVPYWGNDPVRDRNHEAVIDTMTCRYPFDMFVGTPQGVYNRGMARNALVDQVTGKADVIVLCDSDIIGEKIPLQQAIEAAYRDGGLHFPYNAYKYLTEESTEFYLDGWTAEHLNCDMEGPGSYGGIMVIRPDEWWKAGGSPELNGWGFEDIIFAIQARTLLDNDLQWYEGDILHLWHPSEVSVGSPSYNSNISLCKKFELYDGDREGIQTLIQLSGAHRGSSRSVQPAEVEGESSSQANDEPQEGGEEVAVVD